MFAGYQRIDVDICLRQFPLRPRRQTVGTVFAKASYGYISWSCFSATEPEHQYFLNTFSGFNG